MTLKEIKEHYIVYKRDKKYHLHSKKVGDSRQVHKYICSLSKEGNFFRLGDKIPTSKINILLEQINEYLNNLEYDSEYYCPSYRKGFAQECFIMDLLSDYGFCNPNWRVDYYELKSDSIYGYSTTDIKLLPTVNIKRERITVHLITGMYSTINVSCGFDFKEIHSTIDGLLKPLLLSEGIKNINLSEKMRMSKMDYVLSELKGFDVVTNKIDLKTKLLELANTL